MKILVTSEGRTIRIAVPTGLVFNKGSVWLASRFCANPGMDRISEISSAHLERLFAELRRMKRKYGAWELVNVQSASGETVKIII